MPSFNDIIKDIQLETKWQSPFVNSHNFTCFTLLGKMGEELELQFFALNDSTLLMQVHLEKLPTDTYEKNALIKDYAKKQVSACKTRASILTLDNNYFSLYKKVSMQNSFDSITELNSFLKDVDWWLQKENSNYNNPFSFSMSWNK